MKFLITSDLHTEFYKTDEKATRAFPPLPDSETYDAVLLAGDIGLGVSGMLWAKAFFPADKTLLYIPGNHEYYKQIGGIGGTDARLTQTARENGIVFLNPGVWLGDGVAVIAAALWTDFRLDGYNPLEDRDYANAINDFRVIYENGAFFTPEQSRRLYEKHRAFLKREIKRHSDKGLKIVVMTHWVPSQVCIAPQYANDPYNPYFTNDCDDLMQDGMVWVYGHTHAGNDLIHASGARLIGNPFGYPHEPREPYKWKIISV